MRLTLGFSPCPNDTFIFDALVNKKIDTEDLTFEVALEDVETLNSWAIEGRFDFTKLSYGVLPLVLDHYLVLNSGSALGKGVGPILISSPLLSPTMEYSKNKNEIEKCIIAIPGEHTTAHFLFSLAYPNAKNKVFLRYDEIEDYVLSGKGPGVIIHENRFTYEQNGLILVTDLGSIWEKETGLPIPLGGIVAKRKMDPLIKMKADRMIRQSIQYAFKNYPFLNDYIRRYSQELSEDVIRKHIDLYVNEYTSNLGTEGKSAVKKLLEVYKKIHPGTTFLINEIFL